MRDFDPVRSFMISSFSSASLSILLRTGSNALGLFTFDTLGVKSDI